MVLGFGIKKRTPKGIRDLTPEEALKLGFTIEPNWMLRETPRQTPTGEVFELEEPTYTFVSPEGWEYEPVWGEEGTMADYTAISPVGQRFTKTELEAQILGQETLAKEQEDLIKSLEPFKTPEGLYDITKAREVISEENLLKVFGQIPITQQVAPIPTEIGDIETSISQLFPDLTLEIGTPQVLQNLYDQAIINPEQFIQDIVSKGDRTSGETIIKAFFEVSPQELESIFVGVPPIEPAPYTELPSLFLKALPLVVKATNIEQMMDYFSTRPDTLRRNLITAGRNADTEALVKSLYPEITERGLADYFSPRAPGMEILGQLPTRTWLDKVKEIREDPTSIVPFVASGKEIVTLSKLMKTAKDLEDGKEVSREDLLALKAYVDKSVKDTTWGYEVADVITQLVPFAGEFLATGGIFSVGKTAAVKAGQAALKRIATKTGLRILEGKLAKYGLEVAGIVAGGTLRAIPAGVTRIPASTLEKQLQATLTGDEEAVWQSALKALGEQWVEVVSESTGGLFAPLAAPIKGQLIKAGLFKAFLKANPTAKANDVRRVFEKLGYHGVIGEMLEERVADVGHGILEPLGLSDQKFSIPSMRQLSVELVAFSVPGAAVMAIQNTPGIFEKLTPSVKKAISEAAAEARLAPERGAIEIPGKPEVPKEPWQMTKAEYVKPPYTSPAMHRYGVTKALSEGKPVPAEVLAEYPDLAKVTPVTPEVTRDLAWVEARIKDAQREIGLEKKRLKEFPQFAEEPAVKEKMTMLEERLRIAKGEKERFIAIPKAEVGMPEVGGMRIIDMAKAEALGVADKRALKTVLRLLRSDKSRSEYTPAENRAWGKYPDFVQQGILGTREIMPEVPTAVPMGEAERRIPEKLPLGVTREQQAEYTKRMTPFLNEADAKIKKVNDDFMAGKTSLTENQAQRDAINAELDKQADKIRTEMGFLVTPPAEVAKIKELTEKPLAPRTELTPEEVKENWSILGQPKLNIKQIDALVGFFADYIDNPTTVSAWELTRELRRETLSGRAENLKARAQQLIVQEGITSEEAINQAIRETMAGELPTLTSEYLEGMTTDLRDALFAKVYLTLKDDPFEMMSTASALTNALTGKAIPRDKPTPPPGGFKSRIWPQGASAYDKLKYVFGDQPKVLKAIDKMATEKKPLQDVVEGIYHETGRAPIPVDQAMADYLRGLSGVPFGYSSLLDKPFILPSLPLDTRTASEKAIDLQNFKLELTPDLWKGWTPEHLEGMSYLRINLLKTEYQTKLAEAGWTPPSAIADQRTPAQRALDLTLFKIEMAIPPIPVAPTAYKFEAPIEDAFKQMPLLPRPVKDNIYRILKEIGMFPVDFGNFLRANKASFDFSFWRQQAPLIVSHPISFVQANIEAWKAIWSQKSAEASWQRITRDPIYQIYEECEREGGDFLRPLILKKGTAQWRGVEEYGYITGERALPKLTGKLPWIKLSARSFETGTNVHNWLIFRNYYKAMLKLNEMYASGQKTLKAGEAFDITKEMVDFSKMQANFTARGSLGKFAATAPELSAFFFAPRMAIGRILSVKDLINANPRVRAEAWKNASTFVSTFGGLVLLGAAMGWWEVETDPRSAEYMSIRIGNTRIDPWGGYRQFVVFFARAITGTGVSSVTGAEYEVDPINLIQTFIRGKASPLASLILDAWRGKNFVGEEFDVANKEQWAERIAPFAVWDIYEAYKDDPTTGFQVAIPAIVGAGVQTYTGDWVENWAKLGLPKYSDNLAYGLTEPKYLTDDFWSDHSGDFKGVDPATLTKAKGFPEYIRAMVEARVILEHLNTLPSKSLASLNADLAKGLTFADYYKQWRDREKLVAAGDKAELTINELQPDGTYKAVTYKGEDALIAFDQDERTRNANNGNFSQRDFALLNEYWSITDKKKQAEFLEAHPELSLNPRTDYLKTHSKENAQLAVWGQAKILTKEAYNQFLGLVKTLDIPDSAIPEMTLPPEGSIDNYFKYQDMENKNSLEAKLMLAKDPDLLKFLDRQPIDTPIASLELKVKNRKLYDTMGSYSDKDSPQYIVDEKTRAEAIKKFKTDNPEFVDDMRRIEAIEKGTDKIPTLDTIIQNHIDYGNLIDKEGVGSSSAEVMLYRVDNPDYNTFRMDDTIWDDNALSPIDESRIPIWRIDIKYAKEDAEYDALPTTGTDRTDYLATNNEYRLDRRRREAYQKGLTAYVEDYVSYYELPTKGYRRDRFLVNNPDFANALGLKTPENVPNVAYDDIYDQYEDLFEQYDETDTDGKKRIFAQNPAFKEAYYRRNAYGLFFPENFVENYVVYNLMPTSGWDRERYLKENRDFYNEIYTRNKWTSDEPNWDWIPTKKVEDLYNEYQNLPTGNPRLNLRYQNPELDEWLLLTGKVSQPAKYMVKLSQEDRQRLELERILGEIEARLGGLE